MATNLQIDDRLITKALKLGGHPTKKAAVTQALVDYIHHLEQEKITSLFGSVEYDPRFDYKKQRKRKTTSRRPAFSTSAGKKGSKAQTRIS